MFNNNPVKTNTTEPQASPTNPDIAGVAMQILYLKEPLVDTQHYACAKIVDLQDTLASLFMCLDPEVLPTHEIPLRLQQAIAKVRAVLRKTSNRLHYYRYNLSTLHLDHKNFISCDVGHLVEGVLNDRPVLKSLSYEWINTHNFCFYGAESVAQAMIANLFDVAYQAAYKAGQGVIKLWTSTQGHFNQLHVQVDVDVHTPRHDDRRWSNIAPQASFRLTLALCQKVMSLLGGNIYLISAAQGTHFMLSFPQMAGKTEIKG